MKASAILGLLPAAAVADPFNVAFHAKEASHLYNVIRSNPEIDYGCKPVVMRSESEHKLHAIVSSEQLEVLKRDLDPDVVKIDMLHNLNKRQTTDYAPIGQGDRFKGGKVAPRGLGTRKKGEKLELGPILNVEEIRTALEGLKKEYGIELFTAPEKTYEGRRVYGGVANKDKKKKKDEQYIYLASVTSPSPHGTPTD